MCVYSVMEKSDHLSSLSPAELRLLIRQEDSRIITTTGLANGKNQFLWRCSDGLLVFVQTGERIIQMNQHKDSCRIFVDIWF